MAITRLSGGNTPANGADPRTFPAIWNGTADDLEAGDYGQVPYVPVQGWSYGPFGNSSTSSALDRVVYTCVYFPRPTAVDLIRCQVTTASVAGVARLGIYAQNATTGLPGTLLLDAGTVSTTTTGIKSITISTTISGMVWCALVPQTEAASFTASNANNVPYFGGQGLANITSNSRPTQTGVSGALPATANVNGSTTTFPFAQLRVA